MKKILITGSRGQLGSKLREILGTDFDLIATDREELDITNKQACQDFIAKTRPDFIVHCAAYTAVDRAEDEAEVCHQINVEGASNIVSAANSTSSALISISTDYVFDGKNTTPYVETDPAKPLSVYGQTKLEGERAIARLCTQHYIIRTSWLFGENPNAKTKNFVEKMIELGETRKIVKVVNDQIGSPTYTNDLAQIIVKLIDEQPPSGIYHFSGADEASWYDFASEIFKQTNIVAHLEPISSNQFPQKATRPKYSYLSKNKIERILNLKTRPWQQMLQDYLKTLNK